MFIVRPAGSRGGLDRFDDRAIQVDNGWPPGGVGLTVGGGGVVIGMLDPLRQGNGVIGGAADVWRSATS